MTTPLVLSLWHVLDLLGQAFTREDCCVVVPLPDLVPFHLPAGKFDGIIAGPLSEDVERCVMEAQPAWFLLESYRDVAAPRVEGYGLHSVLMCEEFGADLIWWRVHFGTHDNRRLFDHDQLQRPSSGEIARAVLQAMATTPAPVGR